MTDFREIPPLNNIMDKERGDLNLRLQYWGACPDTYSTDEDDLVWVEDRARVWFDHKIKAWRAAPIHTGVGYLIYREEGREGATLYSVGYDPMDAVDQLSAKMYAANRKSNIGWGTWAGRKPTEMDSIRGYGIGFEVNPYSYRLGPEYACTVVKVRDDGIWCAYLEQDDGCTFFGLSEMPNRAVVEMLTAVSRNNYLVRVPGTNITIPAHVATAGRVPYGLYHSNGGLIPKGEYLDELKFASAPPPPPPPDLSSFSPEILQKLKRWLPPPPPPAAPAPAPPPPSSIPVTTDDEYQVEHATISEGDQRYLNVTLASAKGRCTFRFLLNAKTEPTKERWNKCLASFLIGVDHPQLRDTDELLGKRIRLTGSPVGTIASAERILTAIGFATGSHTCG